MFAIAREWVRQGSAVHFVALEFDNTDPTLPGPYLERLKRDGVITGYDRILALGTSCCQENLRVRRCIQPRRT